MRPEPYAVQVALASATTATDTDIVAAVTGQQIRVWKIVAGAAAAQDITLKSATTTKLVLKAVVNTIQIPYDSIPIIECAAGEKLQMTTSAAQQTNIAVWYTIGPVEF